MPTFVFSGDVVVVGGSAAPGGGFCWRERPSLGVHPPAHPAPFLLSMSSLLRSRIQLSAPGATSADDGASSKKAKLSPPELQSRGLHLALAAATATEADVAPFGLDDAGFDDTPVDDDDAPTAACTCAAGCRRPPNHIGLCVTGHGLAPPSIKMCHALSKARPAEPPSSPAQPAQAVGHATTPKRPREQ